MPAARLRRHRRLLALCALSALLHAFVLRWIAVRSPAPARAFQAAPADRLVLRLAPAPTAASMPAPVPASTPAPEPAPTPAIPPKPAPEPARADGAVSTLPALPALPANPLAPAPAAVLPVVPAPPARPIPLDRGDPARRDDGTSVPASSSAGALPDGALPAGVTADGAAPAGPAAEPAAQATPVPSGRYRVRLPPPVLLTYAHTRQAPGMPAQRLAGARIDWRSDGTRYALRSDGVLGRLDSSGDAGDAGMLPRRAVEWRGERALVTRFTGDGQVLFADGGAAADSLGVLDRAVLPLQLAAIGLAEPERIERAQGRPLEVAVAGAARVEVLRFDVAGLETVATALGALPAWRLAQRAAPGQARLEVWLAPRQGWLPVQLRVTDGGVSATQTLEALEALKTLERPPPAPGPDAPAAAARVLAAPASPARPGG